MKLATCTTEVAQTADEVWDYVEAVQTSDLLSVSGLSEEFHLLADFGGALLAGRGENKALATSLSLGSGTTIAPGYAKLLRHWRSARSPRGIAMWMRINSRWPILDRLEGTAVELDELDYLAKRLDSF